MDRQFTKANGELIDTALHHFFPGAVVARHVIEDETKEVKATVQGPMQGNVLTDLLDVVAPTKREFSIYRSGTGMTIKFV